MPIIVDSPIIDFAEEAFHVLAHDVMGIVFAVHNEFGRLMDEDVYQRNILHRCQRIGIRPAKREVLISVKFHDFEKRYRIDLLFANGLMVETKAVTNLNSSHRVQALNYLLLTGMKHGLLVNLRTDEVQKEFVSTTLDLAERRRVTECDADWMPVNSASVQLIEFFRALIRDWGAFLQIPLYREGIIHLFGGIAKVQRRIPVFDGAVQTGTHEVCLIADDTALAITALKSNKPQFKDHLKRFLRHTRLQFIQWINMDHHAMEFRTLVRR